MLHSGIFHRDAETSSGKQQQHPQTQLTFPNECCDSQCRSQGKEAFAVCGFLQPGDWAQASSSSPQNISQRMLCFLRGFGLEQIALHRCFLSKASVVSGKQSCGRAGAFWALLSRAPCSPPGFTLPGRIKQTQPQPCSGTLCTLPSPGVGITWPFTLALRRSRGLAQCFPHGKGDVTGSLHTARALNRELSGTVLTPSP